MQLRKSSLSTIFIKVSVYYSALEQSLNIIGSLSTDWIWCLKDMLGTVNDVYALHGLLKSHAQLGVNTLYSY